MAFERPVGPVWTCKGVAMRTVIVVCMLMLASNGFAAGSICYDDNNAFATVAPDGWVADYDTANRLGLCVMYILEGTDFDTSPAVIYPRLVATEDPDETAVSNMILQSEKMLRDRGGDKLSIIALPTETNGHGVEFQVRYFRDGPAPNEYEMVAYHGAKNAVFLVVYSTRSESVFEAHKAKLKEVLGQVVPMSRK